MLAKKSANKKLFFLGGFVLICLILGILQAPSILSSSKEIFFSIKPIATGGASVSTTGGRRLLTQHKTDYEMKPGKLEFGFDEKFYPIQLRKVEQSHAEFFVYGLDDPFILKPNEGIEIDLDKDGVNDIFVELDEIISMEEENSGRSADFFISEIRKDN